MGGRLPEISLGDFAERVRAHSPAPVTNDQVALLHLHYQELRRWNRRMSLVGTVTAAKVVERHYCESLAAMPLLGERPGRLLDVGSGAGFPGFVLAVMRPDVEVILTESKVRKWSFLRAVCRRTGLSAVCLNARVGAAAEELPRSLDWITSRAVRFEELGLETLLPRLDPAGALLYWAGRENPEVPRGLRVSRQIRLSGSASRRIVEIVRNREEKPGE